MWPYVNVEWDIFPFASDKMYSFVYPSSKLMETETSLFTAYIILSIYIWRTHEVCKQTCS